MIYLLTGAKNSGKSTALEVWSSDRDDIGGVISPDIDSLRHFKNISNGEILEFQVSSQDERRTIEVGRFIFLSKAFIRASRIIMGAVDSNKKYVVVDEIGKLELISKEGFRFLVDKLVSYKWKTNNLILVIREELLEMCIQELDLREYKVISKEALDSIDV